MINGACPSSNTPYDANNRINGGSYDPAGNQFVVNGNTLVYDAENRLVSETDGVTHAVETYGYDGDGCRVSKTSPSGTTYYVHDALGQLAAEYSTITGSSPCTTCYLSADHLGSTRLVTNASGTVIARHDYLPFGEEIGANTARRDSHWGPANDTVNQKFTGKERDTESGLDYFGARYLSGALGRFTSADPENAGADPSDPQTWNAYSYVVNQPLNLTDPDGRDAQADDPCRGRPKPCSGTTVRAKVDELLVIPAITVVQLGQDSREFVRGILDWAAQPRNSTCLAASTAGGASVGSQVGLLGFAGGPTGLATEPAGFAIGGGIGWAGGMVACMSGTGTGGTSSGSSSGSTSEGKVRFGNNRNQEYHTFRHVEEAGIDKGAAERAIRNDLAGSESALPRGLITRQVTVGGRTLRYNAFKLQDGTINVGRITVH